MLKRKLPAYILRELGRALRRFLAEQPEAFDLVFAPLQRFIAVADMPHLTGMLRACGLISGDERITSPHRVRHVGDRVYLMELGQVEYFQDVWPETDALLGALAELPAGRLLDIGTGCGIIAIEAARRGHRVMATDLDPMALELAQVNAHLNDIEDGAIEFREGDLYAPVAGETFDAILTAPHYDRVHNQLRVDVLVGGPAHLAPGGRLCLATVMEWEAPGHLSLLDAMEPRLPPEIALVATPIESSLKREWFAVADVEQPLAHIPSEHRFLVSMTRLTDEKAARPSPITWPAEPFRRHFVPLERLLTPGSTSAGRAVLSTRADVDRLRALVAAFAEREVLLDGALPAGLLDACRLSKVPCVAADRQGAAAIVSADGSVRPCAHGGSVATVADRFATLEETYWRLRHEVEARRGCATCSAAWMCSRCLFPTPFSEAEYCDFQRETMRVQPALMRFLRLGEQLAAQGITVGPLRIVRAPWGNFEPASDDDMGGGGRRELQILAERWNTEETWTVLAGRRGFLSYYRGTEYELAEVGETVVVVGEAIVGGATATTLQRLAGTRGWHPILVEQARRQLAAHFGQSQ